MPDLECYQNPLRTDKAYFDRFNAKVAERRIPLSGTIDLTWSCNLNCIHCYRENPSAPADCGNAEIRTEKWKQIIDEITAAGCLHLLITGGEPFLRKDFPEIYQHAIQNGLLVTVFSNATCVTDDILELFIDLPPQAVEVSLYGATADTYERITRVKGSHAKCMQGIERLLENGIRVSLKTILMSVNLHEFTEIEDIARRYGVKFRFDAAIFPRLDGDLSPIDYRVGPETAVQMEMADDKRCASWVSYYQRTRDMQYKDALYLCGAGLASFYINPSAKLYPCLMTREPEYDLQHGTFQDGWSGVIPAILNPKNKNNSCAGCEKIALCGYCPAFFLLEKGEATIPSEYICKMGEYRLQAINQHQIKES